MLFIPAVAYHLLACYILATIFTNISFRPSTLAELMKRLFLEFLPSQGRNTDSCKTKFTQPIPILTFAGLHDLLADVAVLDVQRAGLAAQGAEGRLQGGLHGGRRHPRHEAPALPPQPDERVSKVGIEFAIIIFPAMSMSSHLSVKLRNLRACRFC